MAKKSYHDLSEELREERSKNRRLSKELDEEKRKSRELEDELLKKKRSLQRDKLVERLLRDISMTS